MSGLRGLDAWLTTPPEDRWPERDEQHRCEECGAWLSMYPDSSEEWEDGYECDGDPGEDEEYPSMCGQWDRHEAHKVIAWAGVDYHRTCRRCGADNVEREA